MEPEDLTVIGHTGDLLADIYTVKYGAYLHFTVVLNAGGDGAQFRRNGCSICAVEVCNLARNTHFCAVFFFYAISNLRNLLYIIEVILQSGVCTIEIPTPSGVGIFIARYGSKFMPRRCKSCRAYQKG